VQGFGHYKAGLLQGQDLVVLFFELPLVLLCGAPVLFSRKIQKNQGKHQVPLIYNTWHPASSSLHVIVTKSLE